MTSTGIPEPTAPRPTRGPPPIADTARATFADAMRAEWIKLRSVRSSYRLLLAAAVLIVAGGVVFSLAYASRYHSLSATAKARFDPTVTSLSGVWFAQLAIGALAILTITAEYATGTIRPSLAAVPRRGRLLAAKATILTVTTAVIGVLSSLAAFVAGQQILTGHAPHAALSNPAVVRAVAGAGLYLGALSLFSFAIGVLIRHSAAAITVTAAIAFVLPTALGALPASWQELTGWLPTNAGSTLWAVHHVAHSLSTPAGFALFLVYTAALLASGFTLFARRDS